MVKKRSKRNSLARRLIAFALDELYVFEEDDIEEALDRAIIKFKSKGIPDWRKQVRAYMFGIPILREKITAIAVRMWG